MNRIQKQLLIAVLMLAPIAAFAQDNQKERPEGQRPEMGQMHKGGQKLTARQMAVKRTDQMDRLLDLTDKQYKKIYKLNLKEIKEAEADSLFLGRGGMQNGGWGPGGRGGQRPEMGQRPERPEFKELSEAQLEELRAAHEKSRVKKDKKLRKILTDEQYGKWVKAEQERLTRMQQMRKEGGRRNHNGKRPDGERRHPGDSTRGPRPDGQRPDNASVKAEDSNATPVKTVE